MHTIRTPAVPTGQRTLTGRILLVEDDDEVRAALQFLLRCEGFEVEVAANGREGIQLARSLLPDVIVMDLVLPEMNGFDAAAVLRSGVETSRIPLVAVTASWLGSELERLQGIGFDGALRKPFSNEELVGELKRHLPE
ncbi:MAG: response regulator [Gemmatimonas sp.]|nr:response regulator [Gemmatimonas sp.]